MLTNTDADIVLLFGKGKRPVHPDKPPQPSNIFTNRHEFKVKPLTI